MAKALYGAEILDVGRWQAQTGPIDVPSSAIDALVSSFETLGLSRKVPLKAGHNDHQPMTDGQPALGWVSRVWREGTKLMADFVDMPDVIYNAIKKKLYKTVSVEVLRDVQAGTRKLPWVLDAVALLGADQPAVGTLKDLEALLSARKPVFKARARLAFTRDINFSTGGPKAMTEDEVKALLKKQADELKAEFASSLTKVTADAKTEADKRIAEVQATAAKDKAEAHRAQIKAKFETAVKAEALLPAKRESFYKFNRVDDDASVIQIKLEDVDAYITEYADKAKLSRKPQTRQGDADDTHAATNAEEVTRQAVKLAVERGGKASDYHAVKDATRIVLGANKKLAKAYIADPSGAFNPQEAA